MSDGERFEDFTKDGHREDCESYRLAGQTDEVPFCRCAADLYDLLVKARRPWEPPGLRDLIRQWRYKPGWRLSMGLFVEDGEPRCWAFYVVSDTEDSISEGQRIAVKHEFLIPPASWKRDVWAAWILDRLGDVEMHERNEFARINGVREFAPHHGNGEDPYRTWHVSDYATAAKRAGDD